MKYLKIILVTLFFLLFSSNAYEQPVTSKKSNPSVKYLHNPYSDYLFYLLYRESPKEYTLDSVINLGKIPILESLISLPEIVASANITNYSDIYKLLEPYKTAKTRVVTKPYPKILAYSNSLPNYDTLLIIVKAGEAYFEEFYKYWKKHIEPDELKSIATWKSQDSLQQPLEKLQAITRIKLKTKSLDVACIALHLAGSGNYSPPGIYTSIFKKPDLARFIGHEGTHILLTKYYGKDWHKYKNANEAIKLALKKGMDESDIEEMLCMFLQTVLSQQCGYTDINKKLSTYFNEEKEKQKILMEFENNWQSYLSDESKYLDIIDFMLVNSINALMK